MTTEHMRRAIAAMYVGLVLTIVATIVRHVDNTTANVACWLGTIWAVNAGRRWARGGATAMFAIATSIGLFLWRKS